LEGRSLECRSGQCEGKLEFVVVVCSPASELAGVLGVDSASGDQPFVQVQEAGRLVALQVEVLTAVLRHQEFELSGGPATLHTLVLKSVLHQQP